MASSRLLVWLLAALGVAATGGSPKTPSLAFAPPARGCGDAQLVLENADATEVLTLTLARRRLKLTPAPRTFRIEDGPAGLEVALLVYPERPSHSTHCTDLAESPDAPPPARWTATRGRLTLAASNAAPRPGQCYTIDARLEEVTFSHDGRQVVLAELELPRVTVGHLPPLDCRP